MARTTSHRDRDELNAAVAKLLFDHLEPARVTVYRLLGDGDDRKVQRRVSLVAGGSRSRSRRIRGRLWLGGRLQDPEEGRLQGEHRPESDVIVIG